MCHRNTKYFDQAAVLKIASAAEAVRWRLGLCSGGSAAATLAGMSAL
jgi:hypothetical protein